MAVTIEMLFADGLFIHTTQCDYNYYHLTSIRKMNRTLLLCHFTHVLMCQICNNTRDGQHYGCGFECIGTVAIVFVRAWAHNLSATVAGALVARILFTLLMTATTDYTSICWHCEKWKQFKNVIIAHHRISDENILTLIHRELNDLVDFPTERILDRLLILIDITFQRTVHGEIRWHNLQLTALIVMAVAFEAFDGQT